MRCALLSPSPTPNDEINPSDIMVQVSLLNTSSVSPCRLSSGGYRVHRCRACGECQQPVKEGLLATHGGGPGIYAGRAGMISAHLLGWVPRDAALELLQAAGDLVAEGGLALLVVDLPAEEAVARGGGSGLVPAGHCCVVVIVVEAFGVVVQAVVIVVRVADRRVDFCRWGSCWFCMHEQML